MGVSALQYGQQAGSKQSAPRLHGAQGVLHKGGRRTVCTGSGGGAWWEVRENRRLHGRGTAVILRLGVEICSQNDTKLLGE